MIFNINCGGGTGLNFSVVEYESENHLPKRAEENTIAVVTNIKIKNWFLSKTEPESAEDGDIWMRLCYDSDFEFNALDDNGINVRIEFVKQYIGGYWIFMDSYIYQDGWKQCSNGFDGQLFNNGVVNKEITGGWRAVSNGMSDGVSVSNTLYGTQYGQVSIGGACITGKPIDLTNYNTLKINCTHVETTARAIITKSSDPFIQSSWGAHVFLAAKAVHSINLSDVSGEYYVMTIAGGGTLDISEYRVDKVWLE